MICLFQGAASVVLMLIKMFLSQLTKAEKKCLHLCIISSSYHNSLSLPNTLWFCFTPPPPATSIVSSLITFSLPFHLPDPFCFTPCEPRERSGQSVSSKDWNMSDPIIRCFEGMKGQHTVHSVQLDFFFFFLCAAVENSKVKHLSNTTYKT